MFPEFEVCNTTRSTITEESFPRYSERYKKKQVGENLNIIERKV